MNTFHANTVKTVFIPHRINSVSFQKYYQLIQIVLNVNTMNSLKKSFMPYYKGMSYIKSERT